MNNYEARFGGIGRLYGVAGQGRLAHAHVCVVGIGGVGSWVVEALARTGIGRLTLVDLDDVCISNVNRQLHAVTGEFGRPKVEVMADRIRLIQPDCQINALQSLFTLKTSADILAGNFDGVVDAIDDTPMKALLIARCRELKIPIVTIGGAGGRRDPTDIRIADLARSSHDRLLAVTRKILRDEFSFPRDTRLNFNVDCVYSTEAQVFPAADGTVCETREPGANLRLDCRSGYGTASFLTGAFGFAAAAQMVKIISQPPSKAGE
jgi:tRNA A37 threonylcarbamoyladenosine dehydratase